MNKPEAEARELAPLEAPVAQKKLTVKSVVRGIELVLNSYGSGKSLSAHLFQGATSLAYRSGDITQSRIYLDAAKAHLFVDGAAFDVPSSEARLIASFFGLEIIDDRKASA